jgi:uncharacterized iron-regulated protein
MEGMIAAALFVAFLAQTLGGPTQGGPPASPAELDTANGYVPQRVFDTRRQAFTDFESMLADLARADVLFVGEQHDDPNTHRLEAAILLGLHRRKVPVTLSLEMFERDTQASLDAFQAGTMGEPEFLKASRPWPRYASDYRPLVEIARAQQWPLIAANVPRRIASAVAREGRAALDALPETDKAFVAVDLQCPRDAYFEKFAAQMNSHPNPGQEKPPAENLTERYYWSQCLKDETMAESIAAGFERQSGRPGTIVHYNGAFHSDFGLGTAERVRRRLPGRRVAVVSVLPVADLDTLTPAGEDLKRADYLIYTIKK